MSSSLRRLSPAKEMETPSEHIAKVIQNMPFEVIKYEKNQIRDTLSKTYLDSQLKKHLLEAKYRNLENRINFVQLSIIFLSSITTFLQTIRSEIGIGDLFSEVVFIFVSSYTALLLSVSRFLKWETQKEEISKLIVNYAHLINKIRHQLRRIENVDIELREKLWGDLLKELHKDKIEEDITKYNTVLDTILNSSEKVYYQNRLQHLKVKSFINSKYDSMIDIISRKDHRNNIQISSYKKPGSWFCCRVKYDTVRFLKDMEIIVDRFEKEELNNRKRNNIRLNHKLNKNYRVLYNEDTQNSSPGVNIPIQSIQTVQPVQVKSYNSLNNMQQQQHIVSVQPPLTSRTGIFNFSSSNPESNIQHSYTSQDKDNSNQYMSKVSFMPINKNDETNSVIESTSDDESVNSNSEINETSKNLKNNIEVNLIELDNNKIILNKDNTIDKIRLEINDNSEGKEDGNDEKEDD
jgi:hypothetical protein